MAWPAAAGARPGGAGHAPLPAAMRAPRREGGAGTRLGLLGWAGGGRAARGGWPSRGRVMLHPGYDVRRACAPGVCACLPEDHFDPQLTPPTAICSTVPKANIICLVRRGGLFRFRGLSSCMPPMLTALLLPPLLLPPLLPVNLAAASHVACHPCCLHPSPAASLPSCLPDFCLAASLTAALLLACF